MDGVARAQAAILEAAALAEKVLADAHAVAATIISDAQATAAATISDAKLASRRNSPAQRFLPASCSPIEDDTDTEPDCDKLPYKHFIWSMASLINGFEVPQLLFNTKK